MPTMRAISFLWVFLWSKAKNCDLCSEISCLYICNTKIINLWESSKGTPFFVLLVPLFGATRPGRKANPRCFSFYSIEKQTQFLHFDLESTAFVAFTSLTPHRLYYRGRAREDTRGVHKTFLHYLLIHRTQRDNSP